jgi:hypothetical protein
MPPAVAIPAIAIASAFVWTHVRQALQQTAAVGACSPYVAVTCATRPLQTRPVQICLMAGG